MRRSNSHLRNQHILLLNLTCRRFSGNKREPIIVLETSKKKFSQIIPLLALLLSLTTGLLQFSIVKKSDHRAHMSLNWKQEGVQSATVELSGGVKKIDIPKLRVYVTSGTIQRTYILTPYVYEEDDKVHPQYPYFKTFEATHISLKNETNGLLPSNLQNEVYLVPSQIRANGPNGDSAFIFYLLQGVDGSYKMIMVIYKDLSRSPQLEVLDRVDCLTYEDDNNSYYIKQFKNCESYLKDNNITID